MEIELKRFARMRDNVIDEGEVTQRGRDPLLEPAVMSAAYYSSRHAKDDGCWKALRQRDQRYDHF